MPVQYFVREVQKAIEQSSMPVVYDTMERLLVYLRDCKEKNDSGLAPEWRSTPALRGEAEALLDNPDREMWKSFLQARFSLEMSRRRK